MLHSFYLHSLSSHAHVFSAPFTACSWAEVGYHRIQSGSATAEVATPTIDRLVREGIELNRHYVHMICTPSRAALQSGRLPVHVITELSSPCDYNGAIPRNITGIAAQLKRAGYSTHQVGKWDAGMATKHHTPLGRGYDSSLTVSMLDAHPSTHIAPTPKSVQWATRVLFRSRPVFWAWQLDVERVRVVWK